MNLIITVPEAENLTSINFTCVCIYSQWPKNQKVGGVNEGKWGSGDMLIGTTNLNISLDETFVDCWLPLSYRGTMAGKIHQLKTKENLNSNVSREEFTMGSTGLSNANKTNSPKVRGANQPDKETFMIPPTKNAPSEIPIVQPHELSFRRNLGKGAQGSVDVALYKGERVAVKSFYNVNAANSNFEKEDEIMYRLKSNYAVRLLGVSDVMSTEPKIVVEYMDQGNLRQYLNAKKNDMENHDLNSVLFIAIAIAEGLVCLHRKRIVHRDLKPLNVLINSMNQVKLADFVLKLTFTHLVLILTELETLEPPYHDVKMNMYLLQASIINGNQQPSL
ncbi:hypothetical protein THRCLA_21548 [Thraustotheca clavata]|uniref:Protein kinase domain-containing protein n=1 Tax=Thraustotheca clavata TaxID=74557 RepID=A0A1V9ZVD7_9STRA|nr:hypothetical protein THRCLA_21548 [Thraustotheca clavata]